MGAVRAPILQMRRLGYWEVIFLRSHSWEVGSQHQSQALWPWRLSSRHSRNRGCCFYPQYFTTKSFQACSKVERLVQSPVTWTPATQILPLTFVWAYYITYLSILFLDAFQSRRHQNTSPRHFSMHTIKQNSYLSPALFLLKRNTC